MKKNSTLTSILAFTAFFFLQANVYAQQQYVVDRSFGSACGISAISHLNGINPNEIFKLSTGKYIVVGDNFNSTLNANFILMGRFNNNGKIDTSFGTGGQIQHTFSQRNTVICATMSNDKIYVAGYEAPGGAFETFRAYVAKFNANGTPDTSFNTSGRVVETTSTDPLSCSFYTHLIVQPDGKVVAFGYESANGIGGTNVVVGRRYNSNGTVDASFNPSVTYPAFSLVQGNYYSAGILDSDGSMRFLYLASLPNNPVTTVKLDSTGNPVSGYGVGGINVTPIEARTGVNKYFADPTGKIYAQVSNSNLSSDIRVCRIGTNGDPDSTFSVDGILDLVDYPGTNFDETGYVIHQDSQQRLWSMGAGIFPGAEPKGIIYRYDTSAAYDLNLNGTGYMAITEFAFTTFRSAYFESDDEMVISTITNSNLGITKLKLRNAVIGILNSGTDSVCVGDQRTLSIEHPTSCYNYQWKRNGIDIGNPNDTAITATLAGTYQVIAIGGNDTVSSLNTNIVIVTVPVPTFTINGNVLISNTHGETYQWYLGGVAIGGATDSAYTATLDGSYTVQITIAGCAAISLPQTFTSVNDPAEKNHFSVYPNPASDEIIIQHGNYTGNYFITDLSGKVVMKIENNHSSAAIKVSLTSLQNGTYMLTSENKLQVKQLTVIK